MKWFRKRAPGEESKTRENVASVVRIEQEVQRGLSTAERSSDTVARFIGRPAFVLVHATVFVAWAALNSGLVLGPSAFDPYPYVLLNLVLGAEMVLMSGFILMSQNRQQAQARQRLRLGLQINLLAEQEATKALQVLRSVCDRLGIRQAPDKELEEVIETTHVEALTRALEAERTARDEPPPH